MNIYLTEAVYADLVAVIVAELPASLWTGGPDHDAAKLLLGQRCDIWPREIEADAIANGHV